MNGQKRKQSWWIGGLLLLLCVFLQLALPAVPVQAQQSVSVTTYAAYQEFERGFMIWHENSGEIIAFTESPNAVYRFAEVTYDHLPENPVLEEPPSGLVKPIRGFGRVWGNFPHVRSLLGWGTVSEFGYTATAAVALGYPGWSERTLPDGSSVRFLPTGSWWYQTVPPLPTVPPQPVTRITAGAIQHFERGMMLYAADSGTIWVLTNAGTAYTFPSHNYGYLPDNPVGNAPPPGYLKPILGFGKVWGHFPLIRNELGWAVTYEDGYVMQLSNSVDYSWVTVQLPSGQWVEIASNGSWYYR